MHFIPRPHFQRSQVSHKIKLALKIAVFMLCLGITTQAPAVLLFHDDFEKDKIGAEPGKWEVGHDGKTTAQVVADPKKASNKVLLTADNPSNDITARCRRLYLRRRRCRLGRLCCRMGYDVP